MDTTVAVIDERTVIYEDLFKGQQPKHEIFKLMNLFAVWPGGFFAQIVAKSAIEGSEGTLAIPKDTIVTATNGLSNPDLPPAIRAVSASQTAATPRSRSFEATLEPRVPRAVVNSLGDASAGFGYELLMLTNGPNKQFPCQAFNWLITNEFDHDLDYLQRVEANGGWMIVHRIFVEDTPYSFLIAPPHATRSSIPQQVTLASGKKFKFLVATRITAEEVSFALTTPNGGNLLLEALYDGGVGQFSASDRLLMRNILKKTEGKVVPSSFITADQLKDAIHNNQLDFGAIDAMALLTRITLLLPEGVDATYVKLVLDQLRARNPVQPLAEQTTPSLKGFPYSHGGAPRFPNSSITVHPIFAAIANKRVEVVKILVEALIWFPLLNTEELPSGTVSSIGRCFIVGLSEGPKVVEALLSIKDGVEFLKTQHYDGLFPIHRAAGAGQTDLVRKFIALGDDINRQSTNLATPLMLAAQEGHLATVSYLVTVPGIDVNLRDTKGCTALFFSAIRNYPEVAAALIEAGVDPSIRSYPPPGRSLDATSGALDLAVQFDSHSALSAIIFTAAKKGITVDSKYTASLLIGELDGDCDIEVFKRAFELYPNLASCRLMPILEAATELQSVEIVKLLLEKGFDPTEESVSQRTAIHVAATLPSPDILKLYIDKVGERGITLKSGELQATPVHLAASDDSIACLDLLLSSSSSTDVVNTVDGEGLTPFMWALQQGQSVCAEHMLNTYTLSFDSSVLCTAIQGEASLSIIRRLCAPPIDVNFSSEGGLTALHLAAERGDAAIVELLLKKGASKTALYLGKRPLELSTSLAVGKLLQ